MGSNFGGDGGDVLVNPDNGCEIVQEYVYLSHVGDPKLQVPGPEQTTPR